MQRSSPGTETTGRAELTLMSAADRARAFRRARRHSILVRLLTLTLPVVALAAIGLYASNLLATSTLKSKGVEVAAVRIDPTNLTMDAPKYDGFNKDGSHYKVRAKEAITDLKMTGPIRLNVIDGELIETSGVVTQLKAVWGTFDQRKDVLELYEKIDIDGSTGLKARLTRATVNPKAGRILSPVPVFAETSAGQIRARTMTALSRERLASFRDDVEVRLKPSANAAVRAPAASPRPTPLLPGMDANSGQPIDVTADALDFNDNAKTALFRSRVVARQGVATLAAPELDVIYLGRVALTETQKQAAGAEPAAEPSRLKTLKARGGVVMTNKEDRAAGETLDYDAIGERAVLTGKVVIESAGERRITADKAELDQKSDTALLTGSVVAIQGKNVLKGQRLAIDRKAGTMLLVSPPSPETSGRPGRISSLLYQGDGGTMPGKARPQEKEAANPSPLGVFGGSFKSDPNSPIDIEADRLDVADQKKTAHYTGNVIARQGPMIVRTADLTAYYTGESGLLATGERVDTKTKAASRQGAQLTRVEARNKVVVTSGDGQEASGDWADFDVRSNMVIMGGKVIVAQGKNIIEGPEGARLIIDMTTGITRFEQPGAAASISRSKSGQAISATPPASATGPSTTRSAPCAPGQVCSGGRMRAVLYPEALQDKGSEKSKQPVTPRLRTPSRETADPAASSWSATSRPETR